LVTTDIQFTVERKAQPSAVNSNVQNSSVNALVNAPVRCDPSGVSSRQFSRHKTRMKKDVFTVRF